MYSCIQQQKRKYVLNNESPVSHCQKKKLEMRAVWCWNWVKNVNVNLWLLIYLQMDKHSNKYGCVFECVSPPMCYFLVLSSQKAMTSQ